MSNNSDTPQFTIPDKVAFDSRGIGWRWFNDVAGQAMFSMVPVSTDNDPMYEPLTWFVPQSEQVALAQHHREAEHLAEGMAELLRDLTNNASAGWLERFGGRIRDMHDAWERHQWPDLDSRLAAASGDDDMSDFDGAGLIAAERKRQIRSEGWSAEHDDEHDDGALLAAADCYLASVQGENSSPCFDVDDYIEAHWPWDAEWWKPSEIPIRNLVKAGALVAAEIDRRQRAAASWETT